ncbi:hypothetical protein HAX54_029159, partial [Datura stramonium]|nr:hypothetical protein [Datura stramonium]
DMMNHGDEGSSILLPLMVENVVFHITSTMLYLLQIKSLFGDLLSEDANSHIKKSADVYESLTMVNISQGPICDAIPFFPDWRSYNLS